MDQKLRPVIVSAFFLSSIFFGFGFFFRADVPVPGTVYLLVPALALLSFYISFEGMGRYVSGSVIAEGMRVSRRVEPLPPVLHDGAYDWLFVACEGWQFIKYILNQPNIEDGIGSLIIAPPYLVESENDRIIVIRGRPLRLSPFLVNVLMQRRKWRLMFQRYDGFDPAVTKVYLVLYSKSIHPDAIHFADVIGNLTALSAELSTAETIFGRVDTDLQKRLMDEISLFHTITQSPDETRAVNKQTEEVPAR